MSSLLLEHTNFLLCPKSFTLHRNNVSLVDYSFHLSTRFHSFAFLSIVYTQHVSVHHQTKRRVKHVMHRYFASASHKSISWAFRKWVSSYHELLHEDHAKVVEATAHERARERVRDALTRRFNVSTRDQLHWVMKVWKGFVHDCVQNDHIRKRVYTVLTTRSLVSSKEMRQWAMRQWTEYVHMCHKHDLKRQLDQANAHHGALQQDHVRRRVKQFIGARYFHTTREQLRWALSLWRDWISELKELDHVTTRVRVMLKHRFMRTAAGMVSNSFHKWRKVVHLDTLDEHKEFMRQATQRRIRNCLERRLMGSNRDRLRWGFRTWKEALHFIHTEGLSETIERQQQEHREQQKHHEEEVSFPYASCYLLLRIEIGK